MQILINDPDLKIIDVDPKDSDRVITDFIRRCSDRNEFILWRISFSGFNDDPRELIEIPEARKFAERLIDLGILIILQQPVHGGSHHVQKDIPALDGIGVHGIARSVGEVRRKGKRVNIGMDIDIASYFADFLKPLKKYGAPDILIKKVEAVIEARKEFDPLQGSSKFLADRAFDAEQEGIDPSWI